MTFEICADRLLDSGLIRTIVCRSIDGHIGLDVASALLNGESRTLLVEKPHPLGSNLNADNSVKTMFNQQLLPRFHELRFTIPGLLKIKCGFTARYFLPFYRVKATTKRSFGSLGSRRAL
jgi:hypothetical protein